mgnify:FL=1
MVVRRVCSCCHGYSLLPGSDTQLLYGVGCNKFLMKHGLTILWNQSCTLLLLFDLGACSDNMRHYPVYKRYFVRRLVVRFCGSMARNKDPCSKITVSHHRENMSTLFVYVSHILGQSDKQCSKLLKGCVYDIDIRPTHRIFASKQNSYLVSHWKDHFMNLSYLFNGDVNKSRFNFCQWINCRYGAHFYQCSCTVIH